MAVLGSRAAATTTLSLCAAAYCCTSSKPMPRDAPVMSTDRPLLCGTGTGTGPVKVIDMTRRQGSDDRDEWGPETKERKVLSRTASATTTTEESEKGGRWR